MKKNVLLILLSAFMLTGCELDLGFIKFGSYDNTEQKEDQNNQNSQEKPDENQNSSGNNGSSTGDNTGGDKPELTNEYTAIVATSGTAFAAKFSGGSHFDTQSKVDTLKDFFKGQLEYNGLISSLACTNLHSQAFNDYTYLQFGSGSGSGALAWTSSVDILKVEVTALCYAKYDSYHKMYNIDSWSHFLINDFDTDLTYDTQEGTKIPEEVSFSKTFESGTKSFSLVSKDGRVFVKQLKITFKA